jgi:hypothetical protein
MAIKHQHSHHVRRDTRRRTSQSLTSLVLPILITLPQMRAKRIAAMQRAMAQSASQDDQSSSQASSSAHPSTQSRPESALNRLTAATASPDSGPSVSKSPVPQVKPTPVVNAPQASSARASPVPVARTATTTAVKKVPYLEWECDKIGEILGVSLSVSTPFMSDVITCINGLLARQCNALQPAANLSFLPRGRTHRFRTRHDSHNITVTNRHPPHCASLP